MANVTIHIEGLRGVIDTLKQLPPELVSRRGGPVRAAVRKAAIVIQKEAQANVQRIVAEPNLGGRQTPSTGALLKSITSRRRRGVEGGGNGEAYSVGISKPRGGSKHDPRYYSWFLELGTERMRPHPFLRPAYESKKEQALSTMVNELNKGLARILKKLERQNRVKQ